MPAVTIITPAHHRIDSLLAACASVEKQTFSDWEHLIVHDGPATRPWQKAMFKVLTRKRKVVELGHHSHHGQEPGHAACVPNMVGTWLAQGDCICYLPDDDEYYKSHVKLLWEKIQEGFDAAYSVIDVFQEGKRIGQCGSWPPKHRDIGAIGMMHRHDATRSGNWDESDKYNDWDLINRWLSAGLKFGYVPHATCRFNFSGKEP